MGIAAAYTFAAKHRGALRRLLRGRRIAGGPGLQRGGGGGACPTQIPVPGDRDQAVARPRDLTQIRVRRNGIAAVRWYPRRP